MNNPLRRLRTLPWVPLLLTALLTVLCASALELLLWFGAANLPLIAATLGMLFTPPLGIIMSFAIAMGVGALAVLLLEVTYPNLLLNAGVLWALLLCLFGLLLLRSYLLPTQLLGNVGYLMLMGNMLGIFIKGKPYWR